MVRSGILNSVHAFANDPARGVFILGLLGVVIGGSLLLFALRAPVLSASGIFAPVSREGALVLNNILLCSITAVVVTGTMYPLFADLLLGEKLSVGAPFFNSAVLPLALPLFAAMSVGPMLSWKRANLLETSRRLWWVAAAAAVVGLVACYWARLLPAAAFAASAWLILGAAADVIERTRLFRAPLAVSLQRLRALPRGSFGTTLAHAGLGVTIAGIAGMSVAQQSIVLLHPGETAHLAGYDWRLLELHEAEGPNYSARVATIQISRHGVPVVTLAPEKRIDTTEAKIATNLVRDLYAVLGEERDGGAVLRLHYNPLAPWIWLGALVMALGGIVSLADRRLRVGAPTRRAATLPAGTEAGVR
jgi:cytochrome c-type biogenesis protein CcmF